MMYYLYLAQNDATHKVYIGTTNDLKKRLSTHNNGCRKFTTRRNGTWQYIYAEAYRSKDDALNRERKLKAHGTVKYALLKRLKHSLLEPKIREGRS
jgi:putative endonuclease